MVRKEVLEHQSHSVIGRVVLRHPRSFFYFSIIVATLIVAIIFLILFKDFTRKIKATGVLVPDTGLVRIFPQQAGRVVIRYVKEGEQVKAGQALFSLSAERHTQLGSTAAMAVMSITARRESLRNELRSQAELYQKEVSTQKQRLTDLSEQLAQLKTEITGQRSRVALAEATYKRYQELAKSNFAPELQVQQRADELLAQQGRLASLQRNVGELESLITATQAEVIALPLREVSKRSTLERSISALEAEAAEYEARRELIITAPTDGVVTSIQAEPGQFVTTENGLASIIPAGSKLVAHFYAPSSAIGFVRPGQAVQLRYKAFPYQKFGQHDGLVTEVSRSAVVTKSQAIGEAHYRITVVPRQQRITVYGNAESLVPDMQVEADILVDKRLIIEWMLEPLFSIKGKLS
ncbi:HlyD family secretion protein [Chitinimonas sp. PSY-7]|uniref:HlyD family efflux transporter periplasmic adaptor subunit n=1 Tax=Chitinimonas sp. PSY-7 TaxID=3459088 RepID=UPI00403FF0E6